jgi:hypothetical protein
VRRGIAFPLDLVAIPADDPSVLDDDRPHRDLALRGCSGGLAKSGPHPFFVAMQWV